jgi:hypothetical protein
MCDYDRRGGIAPGELSPASVIPVGSPGIALDEAVDSRGGDVLARCSPAVVDRCRVGGQL